MGKVISLEEMRDRLLSKLEEQHTYKTCMTNFNFFVYEGESLADARKEAEQAGFDCTLYRDGHAFYTYSVIGGCRKLV